MIDIWYGDHQRFGHLGRPQRWANVLGRVADCDRIHAFTYTLNQTLRLHCGRGYPQLMMGERVTGNRLCDTMQFVAKRDCFSS
jgi:hypothetical protein